MTALSNNRNTIELATKKAYSKEFPVLNGEILYAGGMLAINTSTLEVQMASNAANLRVIGICPKYVNNTADGEVSNARIGVFLMNNSSTHPLTNAYIGKVCYVEDDNTVSHDPGSYAVRAGVVHNVDDDGVWVDTEPESSDNIATAPSKPASADALTQNALTISAMTGTANISPAAETNIDTIGGTLTGTLDNTLADVNGSWDATAIATINKNFKELQSELITQRALNAVLIDNCKTFATELNLVKTDVAAVRTGSEANNTAIDAIINNLTAANIMA